MFIYQTLRFQVAKPGHLGTDGAPPPRILSGAKNRPYNAIEGSTIQVRAAMYPFPSHIDWHDYTIEAWPLAVNSADVITAEGAAALVRGVSPSRQVTEEGIAVVEFDLNLPVRNVGHPLAQTYLVVVRAGDWVQCGAIDVYPQNARFLNRWLPNVTEDVFTEDDGSNGKTHTAL